MARPVVKLDVIRNVVEADPTTKKPIVKRHQTIFTDAVGPNASVPDEGAFTEASNDAIEQTKGQDIDVFILEPLP
jgi:hypothetical protein